MGQSRWQALPHSEHLTASLGLVMSRPGRGSTPHFLLTKVLVDFYLITEERRHRCLGMDCF